jgi:hypothetical protein
MQHVSSNSHNPACLKDVTIQRHLRSDGSAYLIVTKKSSIHDDEVTIFNGHNADDRAYEFAFWRYGYSSPRRAS